MKRLGLGLSALVFFSAIPLVSSTEMIVPVALPLSGAYELFGRQILSGLEVSSLGQSVQFEPFDTRCDAEGAVTAARTLPRDADIVIGFACVDGLDAALETGILADKTLVVPFTPPVGFAPTTDTTSHPTTYHVAPRPGDAARALAAHLKRNWAGKAIAVIDDGTLDGRSFASALRASLEEAGLSPVYVTNYRPQLDNQVALARLLQRAGATHVVIGGDRYDASRIAEAMAVIDYNLVMAGGPSFSAIDDDAPLPAGTVYAALPEPDSFGVAADFEEAGISVEGFVMWGYATGQFVHGLIRAQAGADPAPISTVFGLMHTDGIEVLNDNPYGIVTVAQPEGPEQELSQ